MDKSVETVKLLGDIKRKLGNYMRKRTGHTDLPFAQAIVVVHLYHNGKGMRISELSRTLGLSNSTVSGLVDRLEKSNSVIRERSKKDRRVVYVNITKEFLKKHDSFEASFEKEFIKLLSGVESEEIDKISTGLESLKKVLDKLDLKGEDRNDQIN